MSVINIISAIGNNSSLYPLLVRDCGVEVPAKVVMTYNQNLKDSKLMAYNAAREKFIDEYGTSVIWLGGIPAMDRLCDMGIKKMGYNPDVNVNLFKENAKQGLKLNIEKFREKAPKEVAELERVFYNKAKYQKLMAAKFLISTIIPTFLMGYTLPKMNFALTARLRKKQKAQQIQAQQEKDEVKNEIKEKNNSPAFKGVYATLANMSTVNKMALTDGGLTVGRVGTSRNRLEALENGFRMLAMMFLNFTAPLWLAKGLDGLSNKVFNTNVNLDPALINDKDFLKSIKEDSLELPKDNIIEFLDTKADTKFAKLTEKYCGVKYLKNRVRDPREFVDEKKIQRFKSELEKFAKQAKSAGNVGKFAKKALIAKSANILANVGISSFLLAFTLPQVTFILRKKFFGIDAEPGLAIED